MLTFLMVSIGLFFIILTGWTFTIYFVKEDSQQLITEELKNLFDICKKFFVSLKNLIGILGSNSLSSESRDTSPIKENLLNEDEQPLNLVQPVKEIEASSLDLTNQEEDDSALSSFSQEVVEVINEEEEKVAS